MTTPTPPDQPTSPNDRGSTSESADSPSEPTGPSRRKFLGLLAGGAAGAAGAGALYVSNQDGTPNATAPETANGADPSTSSSAPPDSSSTSVSPDDMAADQTPNTLPASPSTSVPLPQGPMRTLVVVELNGGNDGLATLVPYSSRQLQKLRPTLLPAEDDLILLDNDFGVTRSLEKNWNQGLALVQGIGIPGGTGSHFEMERRWWSGTEMGATLATTGFLGRLCDELDQGQPITGLTLGTRRSPAMLSAKPVTAGLTNPSVSWWVNQQNSWFTNLRQGIETMSAQTGSAQTGSRQTDTQQSESITIARNGLGSALDFADVLSGVDVSNVTDRYPANALGWQFAIAAQVIAANAGVRVIHITHGNFDTHDDQDGTHKHLLRQLDDAMSQFRIELAESGNTDNVLIATTSEFGRRPQQSGTGTDHGAASMAMLAGPVENGRFGEHPSLAKLDENDNLVPTLSMSEFYATLGEGWLGVPASSVIDAAPPVVPGLLKT